MTSQTKQWLYGLVAAFIGGASGVIEAGTTLMIAAPETFNLGPQLKKTAIVTIVLGVIAGIKFAAAYLKQSPLPVEQIVTKKTETEVTQTQTVTKENKQ